MAAPTPRDDKEAVVSRYLVERIVRAWIRGLVVGRDEAGWSYVYDVAMDVLDLTTEEVSAMHEEIRAEVEAEESAEDEVESDDAR